MRITTKGQVTIPREIREKTGLLPQTEVAFVIEEDGLRIVKVQGRRGRGAMAVDLLRSSAPHFSMTTDEIMALTRGD